MKFITIFLASSINEFHVERLELGNFIRSLNDHFVSEGVYFRLIICEDLSTAIAKERKQNEYNELIRSCDYFYIILGENIGQYTREEFDTAHDNFIEKNNPKIYTYFFNISEDKTTEDLKAFRTRIEKEIQHYHSSFSNIDAIKLQMAFELIIGNETLVNFRLENGNITINSEKIISASDYLSLYYEDSVVNVLSNKIEILEKEYEELELKAQSDPGNEDLKKRIEENRYKRNRIYKELHKIEAHILDFNINLFKKHNSNNLDPREIAAIEDFKAGRYEDAIKKLTDPEWSDELINADKHMEIGKESYRKYISGKITLIKALKACNHNGSNHNDILKYYEEICTLIDRSDTCHFTLCEYGYYLMYHNRISEAIDKATRLENYYSYKKINNLDRADNLFLLGALFNKTNKTEEAKKYFMDAIEIRKEHFSDGGLYAQHRYAYASNVLARIYSLEEDFDKAGPLYDDAIKMARELINKDPRYETSLGLYLNNQADYYKAMGEDKLAEETYKEALDIRTKRIKETFDLDLDEGYLAQSYLSYAKLLSEQGKTHEADCHFKDAIRIYAKLMSHDFAHERDLLLAKYYYAEHTASSDPKHGLELHYEVLKGRTELSNNDTDNLYYACDLAYSHYAVGKLLLKEDKTASKENLEKAFSIISPLYKNNHKKYADIYNKTKKLLSQI